MEKKKPNDYKEIEVEKGEWSEWMLPPTGKSLHSACCDCGLVHDYEFGTVNMARKKVDGGIKVKHVESERPVFRTRINRAETDRLRIEASEPEVKH